METEYKNAVGKSAGEVLRDIAEFLSTPYILKDAHQVDLCTLVADLNMPEQMTFALMSEALTQGWELDRAESFVRQAISGVSNTGTAAVLAAFHEQDSEAFSAFQQKYGNRFQIPSGSYWATCLSLGIDSGEIASVMQYLRLFTVVLMEFAYMGDANPEITYTWEYYESFRRILDDLLAEPDPAPLPLRVLAIGGSAGKREGDGYPLSLGVDIQNPNTDRMARDVEVAITLKDKNGEVITVIRDRIRSIDPGVTFHFGITKKIRGAATASISATARASEHLKLSTPIMNHARPEKLLIKKAGAGMRVTAVLKNRYDRPITALCFHYQFRSTEGKLLGGGSEWVFEGMRPSEPLTVTSHIPVAVNGSAKAVFSVDFDAMELV